MAAAQAAEVPAHGKCLVKIGFAMALPPGCCGRVAPRSGLAIKKFIDVGAGSLIPTIEGNWALFCLILEKKILWLIWETE